MKNIIKPYKFYVNYALILSVYMNMSFSLKADVPVNNIVVESNEDVKSDNEILFNERFINVSYRNLNNDLFYHPVVYNVSGQVVSPSINFAIEHEYSGINLSHEYSGMNLSHEYSGMNLSHEYEDELRKIASEYNIPLEVMLIIGDQESDGKWDNNGKISRTNDYGVFQINKCNHKEIEEVFGYTADDLLHDPIKNAEAAAYLIRGIMNHRSVKELDDIFGMYNGWTGWSNNKYALEYVRECNERLEKYFSDFEYNHNEYISAANEIERDNETLTMGSSSKKLILTRI